MKTKCVRLSIPLQLLSVCFSFAGFEKIDRSIYLIICENNVILPWERRLFGANPKSLFWTKILTPTNFIQDAIESGEYF